MRFSAWVLTGLLASPALAHDAPFQIDVDELAEIAVSAVLRTFPQVTREDLALDSDSISAYCNLPGAEEEGASLDSVCFAQVTFSLPASARETRFVSEEGKCITVVGANTLTVYVQQDGSSSASAGGGSGQFTMPCTEGFLDSVE